MGTSDEVSEALRPLLKKVRLFIASDANIIFPLNHRAETDFSFMTQSIFNFKRPVPPRSNFFPDRQAFRESSFSQTQNEFFADPAQRPGLIFVPIPKVSSLSHHRQYASEMMEQHLWCAETSVAMPRRRLRLLSLCASRLRTLSRLFPPFYALWVTQPVLPEKQSDRLWSATW